MHVHIWPSEHWVDDEAWATIVEVANAAEADIRSHLRTLEQDLYLLVNQTSMVIRETAASRSDPTASGGTWTRCEESLGVQ